MKRLLASFILALVIPVSVAAATIDDITARAESGDADAQFSLAEKYEKGDGIGKDETATAQWYSKAADLGHVEAKFRLGRLYNGGRGVEKDACRGLYYIQNAAELGHVMAQYVTGLMYRYGRCSGVKDPASAQHWLELAAANGSGQAADSLGFAFHYAEAGFEKNYEKSVYWYKKAMHLGGSYLEMAATAQSIAFCYYQGGYGLTQDDQQALNWLYIAVRIGEGRKVEGDKHAWLASLLERSSSIKKKVDLTLPDNMKAIATAAADDWWQQNSHRLTEE